MTTLAVILFKKEKKHVGRKKKKSEKQNPKLH